jgi:hypothetical protein
MGLDFHFYTLKVMISGLGTTMDLNIILMAEPVPIKKQAIHLSN